MKNMQRNATQLKYVLYARKSSESEDRQVQSIDDQVKRLKQLAADLKLEIAQIVTDKVLDPSSVGRLDDNAALFVREVLTGAFPCQREATQENP